MLIRKSFVEIFDSMMAIAGANPNIRGYVTLGNPGVGKSRLLSYCIWQIARVGKRVFY
jgi:KaiC/GvpD/RAD55 family RecA-like ATPase